MSSELRTPSSELRTHLGIYIKVPNAVGILSQSGFFILAPKSYIMSLANPEGNTNDLEKPSLAANDDHTLHSQKESQEMVRDLKYDPKERALENQLGESHMNLLPTRKLIICMAGMSLSLFVSFCDQTGITVALPTIAKDLNAENSINWAGTSALLANCVCQVLFGRLADIIGRKSMLITCLVILLLANMLCGFVQTGPQLYVLKAFAGIGAGGSQSLTMTITSDIVTLKQRGKFQGILGANVGLGNFLGPVIMALYVEHRSWRYYYRTLPPMIFAVIVVVVVFVDNPKTNKVLNWRAKLKKIDYLGVVLSAAALTFILIPVSGGGSTYAWNSPIVIVLLILGGVCLIAFILVEWKVPELPMFPLYIFKSGTLCILLGSSFLFGMVYYGFVFIVNDYFQMAKGYDALQLALMVLPLVLLQASVSAVAGIGITLLGHYLHIMWIGYLFWVIGIGMGLKWTEETSKPYIIGTLLMMGTGVGCIFQPTIVAAQANCTMAQRAVVIGVRNVVRSFGGALGIAVHSLIITSTMIQKLESLLKDSALPAEFVALVKRSVFSHPDFSMLTATQQTLVRRMYLKSIRNVFYFELLLIAVCMLSTIFVRDRGLHALDQPAEPKKDKDLELDAPEPEPKTA